MTKIASMTPPSCAEKLSASKSEGPPLSEAEHYFKCEACGGWFDTRDLGAVFDHEGPLPHPVEDRPQ
jgi:hypothetical protein